MIKPSFEGFLFAFKRIITHLIKFKRLRTLVRDTLFRLYRCYNDYRPRKRGDK
uniref:Uncharacterized protein n=1 Tax=Siphoviridae sp. ctu8P6 TaxID=2827282 RepID=A0A8S5R479_9CAUD|nr:MAG TPA: hypothetical protein [Siphoviridae sp. ctu8P6]